MTLTKNEIHKAVQEDLGFSKTRSYEIVEDLIEIIRGTLEQGEEVMISGFGKFSVKSKDGRRGRNPATGEELMLAPRKVVTFKCSGKLRNRLNGNLKKPRSRVPA